MDNFVIKPRWSRRRFVYLALFILLAVLLLSSAGICQCQDGSWEVRLPWSRSQSPEQLLGEDTALRQELLILERNNQVDKQAAALLQEKLINSQEEIFQLRKDLEFYKGIITATDETNSPGVHGIRIKPLTHPNGYRLELILLNIANTGKMVEGEIEVVLEGIQDSAIKRLSLSAVSLDENRDYSIRFRNFQRFENNFILPENFEPQRVFVTLSPDEPDESGFEKIFDWPEAEEREIADVG